LARRSPAGATPGCRRDGSGKTTLANALLAEVAGLDQGSHYRGHSELAMRRQGRGVLRTKPGVASLAGPRALDVRLRPDRIVVGEVRGAEALDMLKAWNTGHPGGNRNRTCELRARRASIGSSN